jgi:hypothetical protein
MIIKPSITFLTVDSDSELIVDVGNVNTKMTGNQHYLNPSPTLLAIETANSEFSTAVENAFGGGSELTAIKKAKRAVLVTLMRKLASYVQANCNNDMAVLLSSGFPPQKPTRTPVGELPAPDNLAVSLGTYSGQLDANVSPVPGAAIYNWRISTATQPGTIVQTDQTTAANTTFDKLTPGVIYIVEANVVGSAGPSDWSISAPQMVV